MYFFEENTWLRIYTFRQRIDNFITKKLHRKQIKCYNELGYPLGNFRIQEDNWKSWNFEESDFSFVSVRLSKSNMIFIQ